VKARGLSISTPLSTDYRYLFLPLLLRAQPEPVS